MKISVFVALCVVCVLADSTGSGVKRQGRTSGLSSSGRTSGTFEPPVAFDPCSALVDRGLSGITTCQYDSECPAATNQCMQSTCVKRTTPGCGICSEIPKTVGTACSFTATFCTPLTGNGKCDSDGKCQYDFSTGASRPAVCPAIQMMGSSLVSGSALPNTCNDDRQTCLTNACQSGHPNRIRYSSQMSSGTIGSVSDVAFMKEWVVSVGTTANGEANYPATNPGIPLLKGSSYEAFLTLMNPSATRLSAGNFYKYSWGGSGSDEAVAVAVNPTTSVVYVAGRTYSSDYPVVNPPSWAVCPSTTNSKAFVSVFDLTTLKNSGVASAAVWSGCWGYASASLSILDIDLGTYNGFDTLYMAGFTTAGPSFPNVGNAWTMSSAAGNQDGFIAKHYAGTNQLTFASRWGTTSGSESFTQIVAKPGGVSPNDAEFVAVGITTASGSYYQSTWRMCTQGTAVTGNLGFYISANPMLGTTVPNYSSLICNDAAITDLPRIAVKWTIPGATNGYDVFLGFASTSIRSSYIDAVPPTGPISGVNLGVVARYGHRSYSQSVSRVSGGMFPNLYNLKLVYEDTGDYYNDFVHVVGTSAPITTTPVPAALIEKSIDAPLGASSNPLGSHDIMYKKLQGLWLAQPPRTSFRWGASGSDQPSAIALLAPQNGNQYTPITEFSHGTGGSEINVRFPTMVAFGGSTLSGTDFPRVFAKDSTLTGRGFLTIVDTECIDSTDFNRLKSTNGATAPATGSSCVEDQKRNVKDVGRTRVYIIGDGLNTFDNNAGVYSLASYPIGAENSQEDGQSTYLASIIHSISKNTNFVLARVQNTWVRTMPSATNHATDLVAALEEITKEIDLFTTFLRAPPAIVYYSANVAGTSAATWDAVNAKAANLISKGVVIVSAAGDTHVLANYNKFPFVNYDIDALTNPHKYGIQIGAEYYPDTASGKSKIRSATNQGSNVKFFGPGLYHGITSAKSTYYLEGNVPGVQRNLRHGTISSSKPIATETAGAFAVGVLSAMMQNNYPTQINQAAAVNYLTWYSTLRLDHTSGLPTGNQYSIKVSGCTPCTDRADLP